MPPARKTVVGITSKNIELLYNRFMKFGGITDVRGINLEILEKGENDVI